MVVPSSEVTKSSRAQIVAKFKAALQQLDMQYSFFQYCTCLVLQQVEGNK